MSWASEIEANNLDQTYITKFLDVSGNIIHRTGYLTVLDGDVSFNTGNLYVGGNITGNYLDNSIPASAINGQVEATPNFNGDVVMNGNLTVENKILYSNMYSTTAELPDASTYHGMFAHVHADGGAYFSHSGSWHQLANIESPNFTGAVTMNGITVGTGNSSSTDNTVVGFESGKVLSTGLRNTSVGTSTLGAITSGTDNTALGYGAGSNSTGIENTFMGSYSGVYNVAGSSNTSVGYASLLCNVAGTNNVAIGNNAIFGAQNNDSTNNTAVGSNSLKVLRVGANNNTAIGFNSGATNTTGTNNTYLGEGADTNSNSFSNSTAVGSGSKITKSDQIVLGKSTSPPEVYIPGRVGVGNNNPMTIMQIGPDLATDYGYDYDENALLVTHPTPISDTAVNDPMTVLYLARDGIPSTSNSVRAAFKLSKYEYTGAQSPKSRLDIGLLEDYNDNEPSVLTLLGNGEVQIPGSLVVQGTATALTVSGTTDNTNNVATTAFVQAVVATVDAGSMATASIASKPPG